MLDSPQLGIGGENVVSVHMVDNTSTPAPPRPEEPGPGDIIQFGPNAPEGLRGLHFLVTVWDIESGKWVLDGPYLDALCTMRYIPRTH